ncbi:mitochondrial GTPase [Patellaria atrata CBS 101060]|uniref:Mitochondrial GTPase n=1 Tax=Patellaria atrata CBS 101060 TaxID=1346257 RepID=A0A9P4VSW4_9PEZI|nr:mitochondrial GTPase [Patellaria atrata CBS 101060]
MRISLSKLNYTWTLPAQSPSAAHKTSAELLSEDNSTIYALSSAPGQAAIAIIRLSGPACVEIYHALCPDRELPKPRFGALRTLYEPLQPPHRDSVLDSGALVLYFPSPNTVTGEDVLELHVHGGPAIVKAVLSAISRCSIPSKFVRYAEPGEFTRRSFMNDRLDLTQVEALGEVLSATTEQQRRLSVRGTSNSLAKRYDAWRQQLLNVRGELEALIDFSEDQHFDESPEILASSVAAQVKTLKKYIEAHTRNAVRGELLRNGINLALLGAPNAGKSSLLNKIVGRDAAIVSKEAGTTRDVVEIGIDIGGWLCRLGDTAGLRRAGIPEPSASTSTDASPRHAPSGGTVGEVEKEGIKRAKQRAMESDVVIVVFSVEYAEDGPEFEMDPEVVGTARKCLDNNGNVVFVVNKSDRIPTKLLSAVKEEITLSILDRLPSAQANSIYFTSCKQISSPSSTTDDPGDIQNFLQGLISTFQNMTSAIIPDSEEVISDPSIWQESLGASERHRLLLEQCLVHLVNFLAEVDIGNISTELEGKVDIVIAAEHLRSAADCLSRITGKGEAGDVEEVLGVVFEKCVDQQRLPVS